MNQRIAVLLMLGLGLSACNTNTTTAAGGYTCSALTTPYPSGVSSNAGNVLPAALGGPLPAYPNEITVSVKVCVPGTSNCAIIPNVLLDTGSNGLRLFTCAISGLPFPAQQVAGNDLAECVSYADGTSHWGSVVSADVTLGGDTAANVPIQIVDPRYAAAPDTCTNLESDPSFTGYNGIVGVGLLDRDCGSACAVDSDNQTYYACSGSTCTSTAVPLAQQVTNPVAMMTNDNNGVIVTLPSIPVMGVQYSGGTVTLGINTQANNAVGAGAVTVYSADSNVEFTTAYDGVTYSDTATTASFIDSGSNALYFASGNPSLPVCSIEGAQFYCPASPVTLSATTQGYNGLPVTPTSVSFTVGNAAVMLDPSNSLMVFSGFAGVMDGGFDWGLPFFMGRTVYVGIENRAGGANISRSGPYWAY
jgi:hypothetical protein